MSIHNFTMSYKAGSLMHVTFITMKSMRQPLSDLQFHHNIITKHSELNKMHYSGTILKVVEEYEIAEMLRETFPIKSEDTMGNPNRFVLIFGVNIL